MRRWLVTLFAAAVALTTAGTMGPAARGAAPGAGTGILTSEPRPRQQLQAPPGWVTLAFDRTVSHGAAKIVVLSAAGENMTTGGLIVEGTNVTSQLRTGLPRGTYTVIYRVDDPSGDLKGGSYQFSYGSGSWTQGAGVTQWRGASKQPPVIADRRANPPGTGNYSTAEPPITTSPPDPTDPSATMGETGTPSGSAGSAGSDGTAAGQPSGSGGSGSSAWWWLGGLGALLVAAGAWWAVSRSRAARHG